MANSFKNAVAKGVGATPQAVYSGSTGVESVIHAIYLSNVLSTAITVSITVSTSLVTDVSLVKDLEILPGQTEAFTKPLNMVDGDSLSVTSSDPVSCDVFISVLEITG